MEELEVLLLMLLMLLVLLMLLMVLMVEVVGAQVVEGQVILLPLPWDWPGWTALAAQVSQANFVAEECRAETGNRAGRTWRCILQAAAQQRRRPLLKAWVTHANMGTELTHCYSPQCLLLVNLWFIGFPRFQMQTYIARQRLWRTPVPNGMHHVMALI